MTQVTNSTRGTLMAENTGVTVPASGLTQILDCPTSLINELGIEIVVTVHALDGFEVQGRLHPNSDYQVIYNTSGAFTSPVGLVIAASGDLTAQASGTTGWLFLDVTPLFDIRIMVSGAADGTLVTGRAFGKARII